jgi:hypothetical protein
MKAYDSVDWEFILHCLTCFGFPAKFTNWVKVCITSPRFSISLNGSLIGYFPGGKGLRQGDPISPICLCLLWKCFLGLWMISPEKVLILSFIFVALD